MAVITIESFEPLLFTLGGPWTYGAGPNGQARSTSAAKTGSYGIRTNGTGEAYTLPGNKQTLITGFYMRQPSTIATDAFCRFRDSSTSQITVGTGSDGSIKAWRGSEAGTLLGTSSNTGLIALNVWNFIEIKVKIDNSVGSVEVRVNGVTQLTLSGIDTQSTANAYATNIQYCGPDGTNTVDFDDLFILDDTGTLNNDFKGEGTVQWLVPSGAGTSTQWTPSAGSNYQNVDDATAHDSDTTYNETDTANNKDMFAMGNLATSGGSVSAVKIHNFLRKTDAGVREVANIVNFNSSESQRATNALSTSYDDYEELFETDPADASTLTQAKIDAMELGYKLIT